MKPIFGVVNIFFKLILSCNLFEKESVFKKSNVKKTWANKRLIPAFSLRGVLVTILVRNSNCVKNKHKGTRLSHKFRVNKWAINSTKNKLSPLSEYEVIL